MQKKIIGIMFKIIPTENPRLELKTYTKLLDHLFTEVKDYLTLKQALLTYPRYLVNHEHILQMISQAINSDEKLA